MLAIAAFVVFVVVIAMIIMIFIKLAALEATSSSYNVYFMSNLSSLQTGKENIINEVDQINKILREILQKELNIQVELHSIIASLANVLAFDDLDSLHDAYRTLESELNNLSSSLNTLSHEVQRKTLRALRYYHPSCSAILQQNLSSSTGNYIVRSSTGLLRSAYCDMTRTCGGITGGWMRVAKLDLNHCPHGLKSMSFDNNEIQTSVVNNDEAGCTSLDFSTFDIHYTKVCGQIRAYQIGTPDGFHGDQRTNIQTANIADNYLDGISISLPINNIFGHLLPEDVTVVVEINPILLLEIGVVIKFYHVKRVCFVSLSSGFHKLVEKLHLLGFLRMWLILLPV